MNEDDERRHMQQNPRLAIVNNLLTITIKVVTIIGSVYIMKKQFEYIQNQLRRIEYEPSQNGRLIVSEYHLERLVKMRYATREEEYEYSRQLMMDRLAEAKLI